MRATIMGLTMSLMLAGGAAAQESIGVSVTILPVVESTAGTVRVESRDGVLHAEAGVDSGRSTLLHSAIVGSIRPSPHATSDTRDVGVAGKPASAIDGAAATRSAPSSPEAVAVTRYIAANA